MSLDYNVYTASREPIRTDELVRRLGTKGWAAAFVEQGSLAVLPSAFLADSLALAWRAESPMAATIDRAVQERDNETLDGLFAENQMTSCSLILAEHFEFAESLDDPGVQNEVRGDPPLKAALDAARLCYLTSTSAGRNEDSARWQELLCVAIAGVAGGVLEDPQLGSFHRIEAASGVPDPPRHSRWRLLKAYARLFVRLRQDVAAKLATRARHQQCRVFTSQPGLACKQHQRPARAA